VSLLVVGDSLAFHGPERGELATHPGLYGNVAAAALGTTLDLVARSGWTARDAWWALTKDPNVYSVLLPRAEAVLLAVGGTYLREGIAYLRPPAVRRAARAAFLAVQPVGARLTRGHWRTLPQRFTDEYLSLCVYGVRYYHPGVPVLGILPPPHRAPLYGGVTTAHPGAVAAARAWGRRECVPMVDVSAIAARHLTDGRCNPDGMHWGWDCHAEVGRAVAAAVKAELPGRAIIEP
jgi:hypothetical protein